MSIYVRKVLALFVIATAFGLALRADAHFESHSASEWAGEYSFRIPSFTGWQQLIITRGSSFRLIDGGCFGISEINHGSVAYRDGVLWLEPRIPVEQGFTYGNVRAMIPVRWNNQLYLVGTDRVGDFAKAIHGDKSICYNYCPGFFVRDSDLE